MTLSHRLLDEGRSGCHLAKKPALTETLDAIRHRFGPEAIQRGLGTHRPWE